MSQERSRGSLPWGRLGAEFVVIVVGVLAALGVDQLVERRSNRELARESLEALESELRTNQGQLRRRMAYRDSTMPRIDALAGRAERGESVNLLGGDALPSGIGFWLLRDTAWETAKITEAVRFYDLEMLSLLSFTYSLQEALREVERAITAGILKPEYFATENQAGPVVFLRIMLNDLWSQERELERFQTQTLRLIREELGLPPEGGEPVVEIS